MKKLSALILAICLMGLLSTTASAAPCDCGYTFDLGPGTLLQTLHEDPVTHIDTPISQDITSRCDLNGTKFYITHQGPDQTCNDQSTMFPFVVNPGPNNTYGDSDDYLYVRTAVNSRLPDTSGGVQTGTFIDFRDVYTGGAEATCSAKIVNLSIDFSNIFPSGYYTSSQSSFCEPDFTATPASLIVAGPVLYGFGHQYWEGFVNNDPRKGIKFWFHQNNPVGSVQSYFDGGLGVIVLNITTQVTESRVEYYDRLRGDLDGNGIVNLDDFNVFKADYGKSKTCSCTGYYQ